MNANVKKLWNDPVWSKVIAASILAVATLIYTVYWTRHKSVACSLVSKRPLITRGSDAAANDLKITYKNNVVHEPWAATIEIENIGNVPIERKDIEKPITFNLRSARILSSDIAQTIPQGIEASIEQGPKSLRVFHGVINPQDRIVVSLILDGEPKLDNVECRIIGIGRPVIEESNEDSDRDHRVLDYLPPILVQPTVWIVTVIAGLTCLVLLANGIDFVKTQINEPVPPAAVIANAIDSGLSAGHGYALFLGDDFGKALSQILDLHKLETGWFDAPATLDEFLATDECKKILAEHNVERAKVRQWIISHLKTDIVSNTRRMLRGISERVPEWNRAINRAIDKMEFSNVAGFREQLEVWISQHPPDPYCSLLNWQIIRNSLWRFLWIAIAVYGLAFVTYSMWLGFLGR
jgi:hypothetical protein